MPNFIDYKSSDLKGILVKLTVLLAINCSILDELLSLQSYGSSVLLLYGMAV